MDLMLAVVLRLTRRPRRSYTASHRAALLPTGIIVSNRGDRHESTDHRTRPIAGQHSHGPRPDRLDALRPSQITQPAKRPRATGPAGGRRDDSGVRASPFGKFAETPLLCTD